MKTCINRNIYLTLWDPNIWGLELIQRLIPTPTLYLGILCGVSEVNALNPYDHPLSLARWFPYIDMVFLVLSCFVLLLLHSRTKVPLPLGSGSRFISPTCHSAPPSQLHHVATSDTKQRSSSKPIIHWPRVQSLKTFPDLCSYFLWASQGLLVSCDLFSDLAVLASRGTNPAAGGWIFPLHSGSKKDCSQWHACRSDRLLIASLGSIDFHCTVNHRSISQDHQKAVYYLLFAKDSCFLIVVKKKKNICSSCWFFFFSQSKMPHQNW